MGTTTDDLSCAGIGWVWTGSVGIARACLDLVIEGFGPGTLGMSGVKGVNFRKNCLFLLVIVLEPSILT